MTQQKDGAVYEPEVLPAVTAGAGLEAVTRGEIDIQIATAKRFPRSIEKFRKDARGMATMDEETAASCWYSVPRAGKKIEGPSVRLAEIVSVCYGNLRVVRRVIGEDDRFVTCAAYCWDIEQNVLQASEVRRRITGKDGSRYTEDMINNTINAGLAIAGRNATFATVPRSYINDIYEDCKKAARGTVATLSSRRAKALEWFQSVGIDNKRVFAGLGVRGSDDITLEHLETLTGLRTAIREGEIKAEDAFADAAPVGKADPVALVMGELACPEAVAKAIIAAWDQLKVSEAGRMVQLKKFAGKPGELVEMLESMGAMKDMRSVISEVYDTQRQINVIGSERSELVQAAAAGLAGQIALAPTEDDAKLARQIDAEIAAKDAEKPADKPKAGKKATAGRFGF